jgi:hypothetical protein
VQQLVNKKTDNINMHVMYVKIIEAPYVPSWPVQELTASSNGTVGRAKLPIHAVKAQRGSRGMAPFILSFGCRRRCAAPSVAHRSSVK